MIRISVGLTGLFGLLATGALTQGITHPITSVEARVQLPVQEAAPKVLVIGIDGVRPDVLEAARTPNIDALAQEGFFTAHAQTGFPTVSGPGWSSLLNGVWSDKHGVTDNSFDGARFGEYPDFLTRLEQIRPSLNTFAVANWLPLFQDPPEAPLIGLGVDARHVLDGAANGWAETDETAVGLAVEALQAGSPDALFVYLGNPDETSHEMGNIGPRYREAIETSDIQVGRLVAAMKSRETFRTEDWLVLISTDHGRTAEGGHGGPSEEEKTIFYLAHGTSVVQADAEEPVQIVDVATTALSHMGVELDPEWRLDGRVVGLARE